MSLTVPPPGLVQDGASSNRFAAEKPIQVSCSPVTFPDGSPLQPETAAQSGFRVYRETAPGAAEVWDAAQKAWTSPGGQPEPEALFYQDGRWQALLVAAGQDRFAPAQPTGFPRYSLRCVFQGTDTRGTVHAGESPASSPIMITTLMEQQRSGLAIEPRDAATASRLWLFLKDPGRTSEQATVTLQEQSGQYRVDLALATGAHLTLSDAFELALPNGAQIRLTAPGEIVQRPAPGQAVRVEGRFSVAGDQIELVLGNGAALTMAGTGQISLRPAMGQNVVVEGGLTVTGLITSQGRQVLLAP